MLFLVGTAVLASFYGGDIPYLFFYFALLLPMLALAYSLYVYCRFKIVQEVEQYAIKGQKVSYRLMLVNEDPVPFTDISLNYYSDRVKVLATDSEKISLMPHQEIRVETEIYCRYRGTYPVGVKSVSVTDFLGLFTITYPLGERVRLTARPRIIPLEQFFSAIQKKDPKNNLFSISGQQALPDYELRKYYPGDPPKYIHWKNSARTGELLVRKQTPEELFEAAVLIDLSPVGTGDLKKAEKLEWQLRMEDTVIEAAISFIHSYYIKKIPVRAVFMQKTMQEILIDARTGFDSFCRISADLPFQSPVSLEQLWTQYTKRNIRSNAVILITAAATDSLRQKVEESRKIGKETVLIDAGELSI